MYRVEFRTEIGFFWVTKDRRFHKDHYSVSKYKKNAHKFNSWYVANAIRKQISGRTPNLVRKTLGHIMPTIKDRKKMVELLALCCHEKDFKNIRLGISDFNEILLRDPSIMADAKKIRLKALPKNGYLKDEKLLSAHNYMVDVVRMIHNIDTGMYFTIGLLVLFNGEIFEYVEGDRAIYDKIREGFKTEFKYI